ncbi:MAG: PilN domain-containing protein [Mariprofundales bacterium]
MIRINLLPYRTERRQKQLLQHILSAIAALVLLLVLCTVMYTTASSSLEELQQEFVDLQAENKRLETTIGELKDLDRLRGDVQKKLDLIDDLQFGRFQTLEMFITISEQIPENIWLGRVTDRDGNIHISGMGESNKAVANFLRALDKTVLFENIKLAFSELTKVGTVPVRRFEISMKRIRPRLAASKK